MPKSNSLIICVTFFYQNSRAISERSFTWDTIERPWTPQSFPPLLFSMMMRMKVTCISPTVLMLKTKTRQPTFAKFFILEGRDVATADVNQLQNYIERTHTFQGVVSFFSSIMFSVFILLWDYLLPSNWSLFFRCDES